MGPLEAYQAIIGRKSDLPIRAQPLIKTPIRPRSSSIAGPVSYGNKATLHSQGGNSGSKH
jgi:hypothetical protein